MKEMIIKIPDKAIGEDRGKFIKVIKVEDVKKLIQKTQEQMKRKIEDLSRHETKRVLKIRQEQQKKVDVLKKEIKKWYIKPNKDLATRIFDTVELYLIIDEVFEIKAKKE